MKKSDIERILKQGSVRQKIKLYMTDTALCNIDWNHLIFDVKGDNFHIKGSRLLTSKERDMLWESIKEPKDVEYYENMRRMNGVFLLFKDKLTISITKLLALSLFIDREYRGYVTNRINSEIINDLLEVYPDKKSREEAYKLALEETKEWGGKKYQEEGHPPFIEIDRDYYFDTVGKIIDTANKTAKDAKDYIVMFKSILAKLLPIQPYREWVKDQEERLIETIQSIHSITSGLEGYSDTDNPQLLQYEEIGVNITEEDLEDFKSSGL